MALDAGHAPAAYGLSDYAAMVRRRWPWLVAGVLAGLAAGQLGNGWITPQYESAASVIVEPMGQSVVSVANTRTAGEINLDTEAQLVRSAEVATRAADALGSPVPPSELAEHVTVTVPPNSQILSITYRADSADQAQAGAAAFSQAYLDGRRELARANIDAEMEGLREELKSASGSLEDILDDLAELSDFSVERPFVEAQHSLLIDQVSSLNQRIAELARMEVRPGRIITAANLPAEPSGPSPALVTLSTLGLGILVGIGLMVARERTDRRLITAVSIERDGGLRVLGTVPPTTPWAASPALKRPAFERLRNVIVSIADRHRVLLMTGTDRRAPVEAVTTSLAAHLAATNRRVVVIDPTLVGRAPRPGLSDLLAAGDWRLVGVPDPDEPWLRPSNYLRVDAGTKPELLHHLLAGAPAYTAFRELRRLVDVVLIVGPTNDAISQTIATLSDGVVHVAVRRRSRRSDLTSSVQQMSQVDARSLGVVVVDHPPRMIAALRAVSHWWRSGRRSPGPGGARTAGPAADVTSRSVGHLVEAGTRAGGPRVGSDPESAADHDRAGHDRAGHDRATIGERRNGDPRVAAGRRGR